MNILETKNLKKIYGSGETAVHALDGVDLIVEKGEFVAVVGTSGSGKSTLLHMLGGLDRPTEGSVTVDGKEIFSLKDEALTIFRRRKIGFVFQNYNLVPVLNVYENIVLPIQLDGNMPDQGYVKQIIDTLGLSGKLDNLPNKSCHRSPILCREGIGWIYPPKMGYYRTVGSEYLFEKKCSYRRRYENDSEKPWISV